MMMLVTLLFVSLSLGARQPEVGIIGLNNRAANLAYSDDAVTWTRPTGAHFSAGGTRIVFSEQQSLWLACGPPAPLGNTQNLLSFSFDGRLWSQLRNLPFESSRPGAHVSDMAYSSSQQRWLAVGWSGQQGCGNVMSSANGMDWDACVNLQWSPRSVAFSVSQNVWMAAGGSEVRYSTDALTWNRVTTVGVNNLQRIVFSEDANRWIVVGAGVAWSTNGTEWNAVVEDFWLTLTDLAYSAQQSKWIAVGRRSTTSLGVVMSSQDDGVTWTTLANHPWNTTRGSGAYSIAYSHSLNLWIMGGVLDSVGFGGDALATSRDGVAWTVQRNADDYVYVRGIAVSNGVDIKEGGGGGGGSSTTTTPSSAASTTTCRHATLLFAIFLSPLLFYV